VSIQIYRLIFVASQANIKKLLTLPASAQQMMKPNHWCQNMVYQAAAVSSNYIVS